MSGSITASSSSVFGTYGFLLQQSDATKTQLDTLTEQASSGLVSTTFSGLGPQAKTALDLNAEATDQQTQITGLDAASARLSLTQSVLTQISSIASAFYASSASLNSLDPSNVDVTAAQARASLTQLAGLLNTQQAGRYIFAGTDTANPPVPAADSILSSPFYTAINGAVAGLAGNGAPATIASTLATAASNAAPTSPFSAALSQPAAALAATRPTVQTGDGLTDIIGVVASANGQAVSQGSSTTGSYIRDLLRSLATIGSLSSTQVNTTGFDSLVADTRTSLNGAVGALSDEQGILGNTQSALTARSTNLADTHTALLSQLSGIQDVDIASVSTRLSQVQTNLQASYKLISSFSNFSLLTYLPT